MMRAMRDHGEGSITRHRGKWRVRLPAAYGRRSLGLFDTYEEARAVLDEALRELAARPPPIGLTVDQWFGRWLTERAESGDYRSVPRERSRVSAYVTGSDLGALSISEVTEADVREWMRGLRGKRRDRLAGQTRGNALSLLRCGLEAARERGLIDDNPARWVKLPKGAMARTDAGWTWMRPAEIETLLTTCWGRALTSRKHHRAMWIKRASIYTVAIYSGLRAGELWGLRWEDVDYVRGVLDVRHSYAGPTKRGHVREVPLLDPARFALEAWATIAQRSHRGLVFPGRFGDCHAEGYDAGFGAALKAAEIGRHVRFHDLRHTCASHLVQGTWAPDLVERAMRLDEVRDFLGHTDIQVTQRYAHLCRDAIRGLVTGHQVDTDRSHLGDLNPRPTVYEGGRGTRSARENRPQTLPVSRDVTRLAERLAVALVEGDPMRDRLAAELAAAVLEADGRALPLEWRVGG